MVASHELILGGVRRGKSRVAESRAAAWISTAGQQAILIASATVGDKDMRERIARHRSERACHIPALRTVEEPIALPDLRQARLDALLASLRRAPWLVVLVSNEIGLGVMPLGRETRHFVDVLGEWHREVAAMCVHVAWMAAEMEVRIKAGAAA